MRRWVLCLAQRMLTLTCNADVHAQKHLQEQGIDVVEGPIKRTGAVGPILSVYVRDPDDNLIEVSVYSCWRGWM